MTRSVEIPEAAIEAACDLTYGGQQLTPAHARMVLEFALPYLAPAGDGGLREALEKLVNDWGERATGYDEYRELRAVLAAHPAAPAVPQPAARYRLAWLSARRRALYASKAFFAEARAAREMEAAVRDPG